MSPSWRNWSRSVAYSNLSRVYRPGSLQELRESVEDAARRGLKLRAVGAGHSWTHLGMQDPGGAILLTDRLSRVLEVDEAARTATVEGGIRLHDLNEALFARGLALPNLGDTDRQAIAGAVSTDTHGSGAGLGSLSETIEAITLVTADGRLYEVPAEEMPAARVSIGGLGVIYSLTLQLVDAFHLRHVGSWVRMRDEEADLDRLLAENRNLEYWYYPYAGIAERIIRNEIGPVKARSYRLRSLATVAEVLVAELYGRLWPHRLPNLFRRNIRRRLGRGERDVREGPSHRILPVVAQSTVDTVRTLTMEYLFALEHFWGAFEQLEESIAAAAENGTFISLPVHLRFVKRSERSWLSPCVHEVTASMSVNFSVHYPGAHAWFPDLERRLLALGGKPHLGKIFYRAPELDPRFHEVRRRLDPTGTFWNEQRPYVPDTSGGGP